VSGRPEPKALRTDTRGLKMSRKHEKALANLMGGHGTIGSGNKGMKGDVWAAVGPERFMIECKATEKDRLAIKAEWLEKLNREALAERRMPLLSIQFGDGSRYIALSKMDYREGSIRGRMLLGMGDKQMTLLQNEMAGLEWTVRDYEFRLHDIMFGQKSWVLMQEDEFLKMFRAYPS
jgi:Holliday junction resolvase